jgi:hypothetical protein
MWFLLRAIRTRFSQVQLTASKLGIKIGHVEVGLERRSWKY